MRYQAALHPDGALSSRLAVPRQPSASVSPLNNDGRSTALDSSQIKRWLALWGETEGGRATLINLSENHTYRIDGSSGAPHILRLHRPGYQSRESIESELAWISALRDPALLVPRPLTGRDGRLVQQLGPNQFAVLFAFERGREPVADDDLVWLFRIIGRFAAAAHRHAENWSRPPAFVRPAWTAEAVLDAEGLWGNWRSAPGVDGQVLRTLDPLDAELRKRLAAYGTGEDRFGLIHADMRLANLLVDGEAVSLIDFDDCGFGWFVYDLAASLSFLETRCDVPVLKQSWIEGYTAIRPLSDEDLGMIDAMILLRRMALLAWIGSHGETPLAAEHREYFARDTARLAQVWLGS
jgi:Ser/Thr protein kinase RdoA (MazF antagonist)